MDESRDSPRGEKVYYASESTEFDSLLASSFLHRLYFPPPPPLSLSLFLSFLRVVKGKVAGGINPRTRETSARMLVESPARRRCNPSKCELFSPLAGNFLLRPDPLFLRDRQRVLHAFNGANEAR